LHELQAQNGAVTSLPMYQEGININLLVKIPTTRSENF